MQTTARETVTIRMRTIMSGMRFFLSQLFLRSVWVASVARAQSTSSCMSAWNELDPLRAGQIRLEHMKSSGSAEGQMTRRTD